MAIIELGLLQFAAGFSAFELTQRNRSPFERSLGSDIIAVSTDLPRCVALKTRVLTHCLQFTRFQFVLLFHFNANSLTSFKRGVQTNFLSEASQ
jgi:hypothetical protein